MEKQKICIIGGGLTGLITAITLSKLNLQVDLISSDIDSNKKSSRTIAISQNNRDFLERLNFHKISNFFFWPCAKMKLYSKNENEESDQLFELKSDEKQKKQILYMIENWKLIKYMIENIKKKKIISLETQKTVSEIIPSGLLKSIKFTNHGTQKYNLIIICTGSNSNLVKTFFKDQVFEHSYEESSITTIIEHKHLKNNVVRQIFLDNEILALLPISNTKTSIVLSARKNLIKKYKNSNLFFKKKIKFYTKNFLKNIKFNKNIGYRDLNFLIRKKYYQDRILLFGDALHAVHPLVGQGFNMALRDLISLEKVIKKKLGLGLDIGSSDILSEFSNEIKPRNFAYSLGIDFLRHIFSFQKKSLKKFRNRVIYEINKNNFIKNIFYNIADKGFKF